MQEIPEVVELLYHAWVPAPDPRQWPEELERDPVRGYGLFCQDGEVLQFLELQADNDHCADRLLQAAREHTGASRADILLAENQTLYLGAGKRCGYGMLRFLQKPFSTTDVYFRLLV